MRRAFFPGSFDPVTLGHVNVVERASHLFDEVVVGIGLNTSKEPLFDTETRLHWLAAAFAHLPNVRAIAYDDLTVQCAKRIEAQFLLRGLRSGPDFEYEKSIAQLNYRLSSLETVFIITDPTLAPLSSTIVRDIIKYGGDVSGLVPAAVRLP